MSARRLAFARLLATEKHSAYVGFARERSTDPREERMAQEFVAGVTRWQRWLDFLIDSFYSGNPEQLEVRLRVVLRIGVYDLLFLSTPDHAAVNESVELAKSEVRPGAARLTNAILRSVLRNRKSLPSPAKSDRVAELGVLHSHPDWLVRRWIQSFGESETLQLLACNNQRPEYAIRCNRLVASPDQVAEVLGTVDVAVRPGRSDLFLYPSDLSAVLRSDAFASGMISVQDEAAGFVVRVLDPRPGETILDMCAAPGGKSTYAAELMNNVGRVIAVDRHEGRLRLVRASANRLGITIVETVTGDAAGPLAIEVADRVLVDAPCSGTGVLAKRADLRWRMSEKRIAELVALQAAILGSASRLVRKGGVLVYSTCSLEREENEGQVEHFLKKNQEFVLDPADIGEGNIDLVGSDGYYRSRPDETKMDGAFAARLVRK